MGADAILTMIVQGGSFALLAWVVYHAVTKALPERDKAFLSSMEKSRTEFTNELKEIRMNDRSRTQQFFTELRLLGGQVDEMHDTMKEHLFAAAIIKEAKAKDQKS